jgi:hypothetical protein
MYNKCQEVSKHHATPTHAKRPVAIGKWTNRPASLAPSRIRCSAPAAWGDGRPTGRCPALGDGQAVQRTEAMPREEAKL